MFGQRLEDVMLGRLEDVSNVLLDIGEQGCNDVDLHGEPETHGGQVIREAGL